ncbi:hypothetical protein [Vulcanisaeta distributa]|uniref:Uncharacterized protein n=1 Tax=Vulcanisaeta distributa (strain DSM 14429 / JCM 11212 / NBRC 100878 / IC-017) TaxID=572478 RepID=E1QUC7_VULDI|nr:hypothetical protein [Vulcanisaeta distributa]ADN49853.1 hypothetical protein Vdis_0453 [Vulcanisaeta distributa DSM 14429]
MNIGNGKLIVVLGPVGVGKSTVIRHLMAILNNRGFRVRREFIKSFHGPAYLLWVIMAKLLNLPGKYAPWYLIPKSGRVKLASILMILSAYIDVFINVPIKLLVIFMSKVLGFTVVSEEYLPSMLFDYLYSYIDLGVRGSLSRLPIRVLLSMFIRYRPDVTVVLNAGDAELLRRWLLRGYGDPQPIRYVHLQRWFLINYVANDGRLKTTLINSDGLSIADTVKTLIREGSLIGNA